MKSASSCTLAAVLMSAVFLLLLPFPAQAQNTPITDDFTACELDTTRWEFRDPVGDSSLSVNAPHLSISVPAESNHGIWDDANGGYNRSAHVVQAISDEDFEVEVKFDSPVKFRYQMQGLLILGQGKDLLRFEFFSDLSATRVFAASFNDGGVNVQGIWGGRAVAPLGVAPMYMRVQRTGNQWTQSYSFDGEEWTAYVSFTNPITVTGMAIHSGNDTVEGANNEPAHTTLVDYFRVIPDPRPDDRETDALDLSWTAAGSGVVNLEPARSGFNCGETVTLTATAASGWGFNGWSGDLSGAANPDTLTMNGSSAVTATFVQEDYTINPSVDGGGTVEVAPDGPYAYNDRATLTATPNSGWTFSGWLGDIQSSQNPLDVTVTQDLAVVGRFIQSPAQLTVDVTGQGTVKRTPDLATYAVGDQISLLAEPAEGWEFMEWGGDISGVDNPFDLTIAGDVNATAVFVQSAYSVTTSTDGDGVIVVDPAKTAYQFGETVSFTAQADPTWSFTNWGGDLAGDAIPTTLTVTRDVNVTARFVQDPKTLTLLVEGNGAVEQSPKQTRYAPDTSVTIQAIPAQGWDFVGWTGDLTSSDEKTTVQTDKDKTVTAVFAQQEFDLTVDFDNEQGEVVILPELTAYPYGTSVSLEAVPQDGYRFIGWSGGVTSPESTLTVTMTEDLALDAGFTAATYRLNISTVGNGNVKLDPVQVEYTRGQTVTLEADPENDWIFIGWTGGLEGKENPVVIEITEDRQIQAAFREDLGIFLPFVNSDRREE